MEITADYIEHAKFDNSKRGYNVEQVDAFLDEIAHGVSGYTSRIADLEAELVKFREIEGTLSRVLVTAENNAKKIEEEARSNAENIEREAAEAAKKRRMDMEAEQYLARQAQERERADLERDIKMLRNFHDRYRAVLLSDMEELKRRIESEDTHAESQWRNAPNVISRMTADEPAARSYAWDDQPAEEPEEGLLEDPAPDMSLADNMYAAMPEKAEEEKPQAADIDMNDILKNLPENDNELKAMIDELI